MISEMSHEANSRPQIIHYKYTSTLPHKQILRHYTRFHPRRNYSTAYRKNAKQNTAKTPNKTPQKHQTKLFNSIIITTFVANINHYQYEIP